jgi:hypothetical protein
MSDPGILDDTTSAHPLDLLLNAITGSGQYEFGHHDNDHDHDPHVAHDGLSESDRQNLRGLLGPWRGQWATRRGTLPGDLPVHGSLT